MAKAKRKTLPEDFESRLEKGTMAELKAVFDICEIDARGGYGKQTALAFDRCPDELAHGWWPRVRTCPRQTLGAIHRFIREHGVGGAASTFCLSWAPTSTTPAVRLARRSTPLPTHTMLLMPACWFSMVPA